MLEISQLVEKNFRLKAKVSFQNQIFVRFQGVYMFNFRLQFCAQFVIFFLEEIFQLLLSFLSEK